MSQHAASSEGGLLIAPLIFNTPADA